MDERQRRRVSTPEMEAAMRRRRVLAQKRRRQINNMIAYGVIFGIVIIITIIAIAKRDKGNVIKQPETTPIQVNLEEQTTPTDVAEGTETEDDAEVPAEDEATEDDVSAEDDATSEEGETEFNITEPGMEFTVNISEGYVGIFTEADEESEMIGCMYIGAGGTIVEYGTEWTKVTSGDITGYTKTEKIDFGVTPYGPAVAPNW